MERYIDSVQISVANKNWYSALALALMLPDICVSLEIGKKANRHQFAAWFDKWVGPKYTSIRRYYNKEHADDPSGYPQRKLEEKNFDAIRGPRDFEVREVDLSGVDCYCLRCSYSHEASDEIAFMNIREALDRFHFVESPPGWTVHRNSVRAGGKKLLQIQVDIFCNDICDAVMDWKASLDASGKVIDTSRLLTIHAITDGIYL